MRVPVPPALRRLSSDEFAPRPWQRADRDALARLGALEIEGQRCTCDNFSFPCQDGLFADYDPSTSRVE